MAAGFVRIAIGSDSGGSIRSPASYCGVVGLKPTYGAIEGEGIIPLSPSLDHPGIMAASVEEAEMCLDVLRGGAGSTAAEIARGVSGLAIAYGREWSASEADPAVQRALDDAAEHLAREGAIVTEITASGLCSNRSLRRALSSRPRHSPCTPRG